MISLLKLLSGMFSTKSNTIQDVIPNWKKAEGWKEEAIFEDPDKFMIEFWKEKLEADRKWEEKMIELDRIKHRFDKLKAPKPKWIHQ